MSVRKDILEEWKRLLEATGYPVVLGEVPGLGPDDPKEVIAIRPGADTVKTQGGKLFIVLPIYVDALAAADLNEPWGAVEDLAAAIKAAVETEDHTILKRPVERDRTVTMSREPGSTAVGLTIGYSTQYAETWGKP